MKELDAQKVFEKLGAPFADEELKWRAQQVYKGRDGNPPRALVVPYVKSRAIMDRLDSVLGWERWENVVSELPGGGILQGIKIWLSDNHSITKFDGADRTNFEPTKGGISSAFKRAAVLLNIGRYLYSEGGRWVDIHPNSKTDYDQYISDKKTEVSGYFTPPKLKGGNSNNTSNNNQGRQQPANQNPRNSNNGNNNNQGRQQPNNHNQMNSTQHQKVPAGMIECTFKGLLEKDGDVGKYLEVWLESNGDLAQLFAIGKVRESLLSQKLIEGDLIAISSHEENGAYLIDHFVKVKAAA